MGQREEGILKSVRNPFEEGLFTIMRGGPRRRGEHDESCLFLAMVLQEFAELSPEDLRILGVMARVGAGPQAIAEELAPDRPDSLRRQVSRRKPAFAAIAAKVRQKFEISSSEGHPSVPNPNDLERRASPGCGSNRP